MNQLRRLSEFSSPATAIIAAVMQVLVLAVFLLFVLEDGGLSNAFISDLLRDRTVESIGGRVRVLPSGAEISVPLGAILVIAIFVSLAISGITLAANRIRPQRERLEWFDSLLRTSFWTLPLLIWILAWISLSFVPSIAAFTAGSVNLALALTFAGWLFEPLSATGDRMQTLQTTRAAEQRWCWGLLLLGMLMFVTCFVAMNWALWFNLRIPHGDSVMYEEHLWNLINGKGFRSDLDQGLFLGEHIQVIHVLLVPFYLLWPSHLLLELCESLALAVGAIPVFFIARRHSNSSLVGLFSAGAYLLFFPLHYLDISIDHKTFRPISFGVPLILWAINALEQKQWRQMILAFVLALACKEDYAIVIAPLGVWCVWNEWQTAAAAVGPRSRQTYLIGAITAVLATAYLLFVVKIAIPWFRNWETVHYARYFEEFGETPTEIVLTMLTRPQLLWAELVTTGSAIYLLRLLLPIGMPCRGWSQLLVGLPLFVLLCLNNIAMQPPGPYHHFHAPLVPILVWAACAAVGRGPARDRSVSRAAWVFSCALATSILFSFSPLSVRFWDPGQEMYWRNQYVLDERAVQFDNVLEQLPLDARIASTDYAHARLTHFARSYDYSGYPRAVANYEDRVPDDTDYIVIDRRHKYSIGVYDDIGKLRELQRNPEDWEVLPDKTDGYFTILKRRR